MIYFIAFIAGAFAAVVAGFFGGGTGIIAIPALNYLVPYQGVPAAYNMHVALGTTLAAGLVAMAMASYVQIKAGYVLWPVFRRFVAPICIGTIAGSYATSFIADDQLQYIFAVAVIIVGIWNYFHKEAGHKKFPLNAWSYVIGGFFVGASVGMIGMGILAVPFYRKCGVPLRNAIAITVVMGMFTSFFGAATYIYDGWHIEILPSSCIGFIDWQLLIPVAIACAIFANIGAKLSHRVPHHILHASFSIMLIVVGVKMLF